MVITPELASFMASPVMIIVGTCDASLVPDIARAVGALVRGEEGRVDLMISRWQWPQAVRNVEANGRLSATFARPSDYVSYQVKGLATAAAAAAEHVSLAARYRDSMAATLAELGLDGRTVAPWFVDRDLVTLDLAVREIFVQTPGANAGRLLERHQ